MKSWTNKHLYFILGQRKCGTSALFAGIQVEWRPTNKDLSWSQLGGQLEEFCLRPDRTGVIAKADALGDIEELLRTISKFENRIAITLIVCFRDQFNQLLSFVNHERRTSAGISTIALEQKFSGEFDSSVSATQTLLRLGHPIEFFTYEEICSPKVEKGEITYIRPVAKMNARGQQLPLFSLLVMLSRCPPYQALKNTSLVSQLRKFYYSNIASETKSNSRINVFVFGSVSGPIDGQRKITKSFITHTTLGLKIIDYAAHRAWYGIFIILYQMLYLGLCRLFFTVDCIYCANSRTTLGFLRDYVLIKIISSSRTPVVAHCHGAELAEFINKKDMLSELKIKFYKNLRFLIFIHEHLVPQNLPQGIKTSVIRNFIKETRTTIQQPTSGEGKKGHQYSIGIISSLIPGKGFEQFLELIGRIPADFHIAGGVNDRFPDYGSRLVKKMSTLKNAVTYWGHVDNVDDFYQQMDVIIFPTAYKSEALPNVLLEAIANGKICVVKRNNQLAKIFDRPGIIFYDDDDLLKVVVENIGSFDDLKPAAEANRIWLKKEYPQESVWVKTVEKTLLNVMGLEVKDADFLTLVKEN